MVEKSHEQRQRLATFIDNLFPNDVQKERLMKNLADERGNYSKLADLSDAELEELITLEREYLGG